MTALSRHDLKTSKKFTVLWILCHEETVTVRFMPVQALQAKQVNDFYDIQVNHKSPNKPHKRRFSRGTQIFLYRLFGRSKLHEVTSNNWKYIWYNGSSSSFKLTNWDTKKSTMDCKKRNFKVDIFLDNFFEHKPDIVEDCHPDSRCRRNRIEFEPNIARDGSVKHKI